VVGLFIALFISYKTNRKSIFRLNIILTLISIGFYAFYHIKYAAKQKAKEEEMQKIQQPKQQTSPVREPTAMLNNYATF